MVWTNFGLTQLIENQTFALVFRGLVQKSSPKPTLHKRGVFKIMAQYIDHLTAPADFDRAFEIADRLVQYELRLKWLPHLCTPGMANDTVAALRQARDLVQAIHAAGLEVGELHRWVVEWGSAWKAEEEERRYEGVEVCETAKT